MTAASQSVAITSVIQDQPDHGEDDVATEPTHKHIKSELARSRKTIIDTFSESAGLVTIGLQHLIVGPDDKPDFAVEKFEKLMGALMKEDEKSRPDDETSGCIWIMEIKGLWQAANLAAREVEFLQQCLEALDESVKEWLRKRSAFVVAAPSDDTQTAKVDYLFDAMKNCTRWSWAEAVTAVSDADDRRKLCYSGHRPPRDGNWDEGPEAKVLPCLPKKSRKTFKRRVRKILALSRHWAPYKDDCRASSKHSGLGISILGFEEFLDFDPSNVATSV